MPEDRRHGGLAGALPLAIARHCPWASRLWLSAVLFRDDLRAGIAFFARCDSPTEEARAQPRRRRRPRCRCAAAPRCCSFNGWGCWCFDPMILLQAAAVWPLFGSLIFAASQLCLMVLSVQYPDAFCCDAGARSTGAFSFILSWLTWHWRKNAGAGNATSLNAAGITILFDPLYFIHRHRSPPFAEQRATAREPLARSADTALGPAAAVLGAAWCLRCRPPPALVATGFGVALAFHRARTAFGIVSNWTKRDRATGLLREAGLLAPVVLAFTHDPAITRAVASPKRLRWC